MNKILNGKLFYPFDIDAIIGYSKEQLNEYLKANEKEIMELLNQNLELIRKIKKLEDDIQQYKEQISILESVKTEQKEAKGMWRSITIAMAAFGALIMSIFMDEEDDEAKP
jgi:cell division septum initiation protein DivIVA